MLGAFLRRKTPVGIDGDHLGALALRRLHAAPKVEVRHDRVRAPEDDQSCLVEAFRVHADRRAERGLQAVLARGRAERAIELRRAELVEEPAVHRAVLHHAHRAGVARGQDGLGILGRGRLQLRRDLIERLVPGDALELALALLADPLHRVLQAIGRIGALEVVRNLGADRALGERCLRVALDLGRLAPLHRHKHRAGVGAVVRARNANCFRHALIVRRAIRSNAAPAARFRPVDASGTRCSRWQ